MRRVALIFFVISCLAAQAQGIYEIKYQFYLRDSQGNNTNTLSSEYTGVLFFYDADNENNIMRIRFLHDGEWCVVEQNVKAVQTTYGGKDYWILTGSNIKFVKPKDDDNLNYYPDNIVLSRESMGSRYAPDFVYDSNNSTGEITSWKVLPRNVVTNAYLKPFQWEWKEKRSGRDLSASKLHVILVTNSEDPSLGPGFDANHRKLKSMFKDVALTCKMSYSFTEIKGNVFSKQSVLSAISNLRSGANDVIVFYYSGHGFKSPNARSEWPQLDLRTGFSMDKISNSINLDFDVYQSLKQKNHRLLFVIGECCNTEGGTPARSDPIMMAAGENVIDRSLVTDLFSRSGNILIATSKPGEGSWYYLNNGGYFCNNFISSFMRQVGFASTANTVKWRTIFDQAITLTSQDAKKDDHPSFQNPIYHFDIDEN